MDQVVAQALTVYARIVGQKRSEATRAEAPRPAAPAVLTRAGAAAVERAARASAEAAPARRQGGVSL